MVNFLNFAIYLIESILLFGFYSILFSYIFKLALLNSNYNKDFK